MAKSKVKDEEIIDISKLKELDTEIKSLIELRESYGYNPKAIWVNGQRIIFTN